MTTPNRAGEKSPHGTSAAEPSTSVTGWSPKRLARTADVLYLGVAVLGGWAHGFVRATVDAVSG